MLSSSTSAVREAPVEANHQGRGPSVYGPALTHFTENPAP
jgi:hypothetical protein